MAKVKKNVYWKKLTLKYWGGRCAYCLSKIDKNNTSADHFIPISLGGINHLSNVVPACRKCNAEKANSDPNKYCSPEQIIHIQRYFKALLAIRIHLLKHNKSYESL